MGETVVHHLPIFAHFPHAPIKSRMLLNTKGPLNFFAWTSAMPFIGFPATLFIPPWDSSTRAFLQKARPTHTFSFREYSFNFIWRGHNLYAPSPVHFNILISVAYHSMSSRLPNWLSIQLAEYATQLSIHS